MRSRNARCMTLALFARCNQNAFLLTAYKLLRFNCLLAEYAHSRDLSIGLKNNLSQVSELVVDFGRTLNKQRLQY